jgi:hypothetical protein
VETAAPSHALWNAWIIDFKRLINVQINETNFVLLMSHSRRQTRSPRRTRPRAERQSTTGSSVSDRIAVGFVDGSTPGALAGIARCDATW